MTNGTVTAKLVERLTQSTAESKKWRMTKVALIGIAAFTLVGVATFIFRPEVAANVVALMTVAIGAWTASTSAYTVMQGRTDEATTTAIADTATAKSQ